MAEFWGPVLATVMALFGVLVRIVQRRNGQRQRAALRGVEQATKEIIHRALESSGLHAPAAADS